MFDVLVLKRIEEQVIRSVTETPLDMEELERLPGIVGYIVQPGDSMWGIAKKFRTTQESVKKVNGLSALEDVAKKDNCLPLDYVAETENDIREKFLDYILPLIGTLPKYTVLHRNYVP